MKKIIQTVADGGGELGVHMYPLTALSWSRVIKQVITPQSVIWIVQNLSPAFQFSL